MDNNEKSSPSEDIITEAVALTYDKENKMPTIVAKGRGRVAEKIIKEAEKANVPVYDDKNVAQNLNKLDIGSFISPEMFEVIAQIYIFVDRLEKILDDNTKLP